MRILIVLLLWLSLGSVSSAQDVLRLEPDAPAGRASLSDVAWLAGHWVGTGLGGECDETWLPATDNAMPGIFRYHRNDTLVFSEYMMIEAFDSTLSVKLKHFNRNLSPWEDKDRWLEFRLVKIDGQTAYFNGLTYHRDGDILIVKLAMRTREGSRIETFQFTRTAL
jgi:hypothetical protein